MKTIYLLVAVIGLCATSRSQETKSVDVKELLGPNNSFKDPVMKVSLTYPAGWDVIGGMRWGPDLRENTFRFRPLWPSETNPSLYYQAFRSDNPRPPDVNAWLLEAARKKEASRQGGGVGYSNDPETLKLRTIAGLPGISYIATFNSGSQKMAEYNLRIVGQKAYVMFFSFGPLEDILAVRSEIDQMAETVRVP